MTRRRDNQVAIELQSAQPWQVRFWRNPADRRIAGPTEPSLDELVARFRGQIAGDGLVQSDAGPDARRTSMVVR